MRKCSKCKDVLTTENAFESALTGGCHLCRVCSKRYTANWREQNRDKHLKHVDKRHKKFRQNLNYVKNERGGCYDCGGIFPPEVMDFDHVRGVKKFCVGTGSCRPWDEVLKEIDKCQMVCATCHRLRTISRRKVKDYGTTKAFSYS